MPAAAAAKFVMPVEPPPSTRTWPTTTWSPTPATSSASRGEAGPFAPQLLAVLGWQYSAPAPDQARHKGDKPVPVTLGGFPWWCYDECGDGMCIVNGCQKGRPA